MFFAFAYLLAAATGYLGYQARALSRSGAVAACLVGGTVFEFGGLGWAAVVALFFASSSLLSFFRAGDPAKKGAAELFDKGGRRDAGQVLANGGVAALAALLFGFSANVVLWGAFLGALAASTADTWATELGVLSRGQPRLITTLAPVQPGTSGAVSALGTGAAIAGAAFIGLLGAILSTFLFAGSIPALHLSYMGVFGVFLAGLVGGIAGSLADSLLGATVQASYYCPACDKPTESRAHRCGTPATLLHGLPFVSNDLVNLAATLVGGALGGSMLWLFTS